MCVFTAHCFWVATSVVKYLIKIEHHPSDDKKYKFVLEKEGRTNAHRKFSFLFFFLPSFLSFVSPSFFFLFFIVRRQMDARSSRVDNNQRKRETRRNMRNAGFSRPGFILIVNLYNPVENRGSTAPVCVTFMHIAPTKGYIVTWSRKLVMSLRTPMRFRSYPLVNMYLSWTK